MFHRYVISGLIVLLLGITVCPAQVMHIHMGDEDHTFSIAEIDSITFTEAEENEPGEERDFELTEDVNITMAWVPSGEFMMGAQDDEQGAYDDEYPRHRVTLDYGFWMGKYEVTQEQWEAVMDDNPSEYEGESRPVERVSWYRIHDFIDELDERFRLPSEAEWEYACRAGTQTRYYWGDDPDHEEIDDYAWINRGQGHDTHPVGQKLPNHWNLHDMIGNVKEWCEDWYHDSYNGAPDDGSVWGRTNDDRRIMRGAGTGTSELDANARSATRDKFFPDQTVWGFRLVLPAE